MRCACVFRGGNAESDHSVSVPHPLGRPQAAEARREAAVLQEQLATLRRLVLCARQRRLRIRKTLLGGNALEQGFSKSTAVAKSFENDTNINFYKVFLDLFVRCYYGMLKDNYMYSISVKGFY